MLKHSIANSIKWVSISLWGKEGITSVVTFILAFILGPSEFGLVAIASIYIAFIQMFVNSGFNAAIIQNKNLLQTHLDTVFWLTLFISILLMFFSILLSGWWSKVNHSNDLNNIIIALSFTIPINALIVVQQALLHRTMSFKVLAIRDNITALLSGIVGVVLAFFGFGVWALVSQQMAAAILSLCLLWKMSDWRPRIDFSLNKSIEIIKFSLKVFFGNLGEFIQNQADSLLLGLFLGPTSVGIFRFADRIAKLPVMILTKPIHTVALPQFSKNQSDEYELKRIYLLFTKYGSITAVPFLACIAALSNNIVDIFGPQWALSINVIKVLCLISFIKTLCMFTGSLILAKARADIHIMIVWGLALFNSIGFIMVGLFIDYFPYEIQIIWFANLKLFIFLIFLPICFYIGAKLSNAKISEIINSIITPILAGIIVYLSAKFFQSFISQHNISSIYVLTITAFFSIVLGLLSILCIDSSIRNKVKSILIDFKHINS